MPGWLLTPGRTPKRRRRGFWQRPMPRPARSCRTPLSVRLPPRAMPDGSGRGSQLRSGGHRGRGQQERNRILGDLRGQVAALAAAATQKLIGQTLDEKRQHALIDEFFSGARAGKVVVLEDAEPQGRVRRGHERPAAERGRAGSGQEGAAVQGERSRRDLSCGSRPFSADWS